MLKSVCGCGVPGAGAGSPCWRYDTSIRVPASGTVAASDALRTMGRASISPTRRSSSARPVVASYRPSERSTSIATRPVASNPASMRRALVRLWTKSSATARSSVESVTCSIRNRCRPLAPADVTERESPRRDITTSPETARSAGASPKASTARSETAAR